jgi:predicted dehydrogenase
METRPGLIAKYGWKTRAEAAKHVKVYGSYQELIDQAKHDKIEAVIIALPLHLHAPAAVAALQAGLHVITEKLMGHSVHECKEMARAAATTKLHLATGHQRHYNILYANAMDTIQRGILGELHYIRAQWHRGDLPGHDSWQPPLPASAKPKDLLAKELASRLENAQDELAGASGAAIDLWRSRVDQIEAQIADEILAAGGKTPAETFGYESKKMLGAGGQVVYQRPAIEELIRWRLWDRTGAGLMAELGSHQLDAASIFISAMHEGKKQRPLTVAAAADRPLFPADRDVEDHVFCVIEFPAPGYDRDDPLASRKKISVQYSAVNGNAFGDWGEIVFGTKRTMILEKEQTMTLVPDSSASATKVSGDKAGGPTMDTQASGAPPVASASKAAGGNPGRSNGGSRGYTEELEHWAWCIRNPAPENQPRCPPKVAMADAVIALTTNMAAREGRRIEFQEAWFDPDRPETPEGVQPDVTRYRT